MSVCKVIFASALLSAACAVAAEAPGPGGARLAPATRQDPADLPCRTAELTIENGTSDVVRGVTLREWDGGPTFSLSVTVPPGTTQTFTVPLLAVSVRQKYSVGLFRGPAPGMQAARRPARRRDGQVSGAVCRIEWPPELVNPEAIIDPQLYRKWQDELPTWPPGLLRNMFLAAVLTCLALAGTLFVRRGWGRAAAIVIVVGIATVGVWRLVRLPRTVIRRDDRAGGLIALTCRRSAQWRHSGRLIPIYYDESQMRADESVIFLGPDPAITVRLRPHEVRLLRFLGGTSPARPRPKE